MAVEIIDSITVTNKIKRIAVEIYEQNFFETEIVLIGIAKSGYEMARLLSDELQQLSPLKVSIASLKLDKKAKTQPEVELSLPLQELENKVVVVVDDVLNSGKTLLFATSPFLKITVKKLQVAVLVDRNHRLYPVKADYTGYELSTTISEHVEAVISENGKHSIVLK